MPKSASQKKPWTRFIKRGTLQERGGGKEQSSFRGEAAYIRRLRRLEVVCLHICHHKKMRHLTEKEVDKLLDAMYAISDGQIPKAGGGSSDARGALPLSHPGPTGGQAEGEADTEWRIGGPHGPGDEDETPTT